MAAVLGLIIGVVVGICVRPGIPVCLQPYLPIMVVAALDALLGAARAYFQRSFSDKVFVTGQTRAERIENFSALVFFSHQSRQPNVRILWRNDKKATRWRLFAIFSVHLSKWGRNGHI